MRFFFILLVINIFVPVYSIKCLQCNSLQNDNCFQGNVDATNCPTNKNHSYCTTYSGFIKLGRLFLLRDCSPIDLGNSCRQLLQQDTVNKSMERITFCHTSCQSDGCNKDMLRITGYTSSALSLSYTVFRSPHSYFLLVFILVLSHVEKF